MKKTYIIPAIQILVYQAEHMIASSTTMGISNTTTVNTEAEGVQLSNSRRGLWGDLWSEK